MIFPTTQWNVLADATLHGDGEAMAALSVFYERYFTPVYGAILARGMQGEEARDMTQDFFVHLMEHGTLRRAREEKGRFRSFLYGALKHFMADRYDRATAARRGGGAVMLPLHGMEVEAGGPEGGAETHAFDRDWAMAILTRALSQVEAERPARVFEVVRAFLPGSSRVPTGSEAAVAAGMSEAALRTEISRVRRRLRAVIREEVSRTVAAPHETEEEMSYLFEVLSRR